MPETSTNTVECIRFPAPVPYREAYEAQIARRSLVETNEAGEALFMLEHAPVFTLGRKADERHLLQSRAALADMGIDVVEVDRGGDVTYHGPGQLVAYPILDLTRRRRSIQWYLRKLEDIVIDFLAEYDLTGERLEGYTGVWVGGAKVAAIGVGIHNWVTFHGIAINVDPDMEHFRLIVPCGIPDKAVTSLKLLLGEAPTMEGAYDAFEKHFSNAFPPVATTQPERSMGSGRWPYLGPYQPE